MEDLGEKQKKSRLWSDNQSSILLANKFPCYSMTKHIHLKYHFIRSIMKDEPLKLEKIHTSQNLVDMLIKVVTREKMNSYLVSIGLQA